jgi:hypothetical protein
MHHHGPRIDVRGYGARTGLHCPLIGYEKPQAVSTWSVRNQCGGEGSRRHTLSGNRATTPGLYGVPSPAPFTQPGG